MSNIESSPIPGIPSNTSAITRSDLAARVDLLTPRQCAYLRLVIQHKTSKEIAAATGSSSYRAVDKQILKANAILGVSTRLQAAQLLVAFEQGVEPLPPVNALPSASPGFPLSPPWPTAGAAVNMLPWRRVAIWTAIISVVAPVGLTAAGMAYFTLLILLRLRPY